MAKGDDTNSKGNGSPQMSKETMKRQRAALVKKAAETYPKQGKAQGQGQSGKGKKK